MPTALTDADKVIRNDTGKEIAAAIRDLAAPEADKVAYDNTSSGLSADDVQDAIDELASEKMEKVNPTGTGSLSLNRKANTAIGNYSVAEGYNGTASGDYSHAEGTNTIASGERSHAEGSGTIASGICSHAEGSGTIANHAMQHSFGQYNVADPSTAQPTSKGNYIEIVGKGTSDANRSNARTLDWNGNETLAGDLKINGDQSLSKLWTVLSGLTALSEKSGSIASFSTDIADKLFSCYVNVKAQQAGSGTPSLDNVRAISGWSACNLVKTGKNILDKSLLLDQVSWNVITLHLNPNTKYTMSSNVTSSKATDELPAYFFNSSGNPSASNLVSTSQAVTITTNADGIAKIQQRHITGSDSFQNYNWQIEVGETATSFESFGTTHNIPFNTTVYGVVLDVLTGVLTVTHEKIVLDGTQELFLTNWRPQANSIGWYYKYSVSNNKPVPTSEIPNLICDKYPAQSYGVLYAQDVVGVGVYNTDYAGLFVRVADTSLTTTSAVNTWLASNPITVVFELATPTVIQLTPTEVKTILGQNNIFGDCGDIDLKYLETIGNRLT